MWRGGGIDIMHNNLKFLDSPAIGELLMIDNDSTRTRDFIHPKIRVLHRGSNMFVNPAWNLGVREAKYDQLCLMSDDIIFNPHLFEEMSAYVTEEAGLFGMLSTCFVGASGSIDFDKRMTLRDCERKNGFPRYWRMFGTLMFLHREAYKPIPSEFKILQGDGWLYAYNNRIRDKTNKYIHGIDMLATLSTTSDSPEFKSVCAEDERMRELIFTRAFGSDFECQMAP